MRGRETARRWAGRARYAKMTMDQPMSSYHLTPIRSIPKLPSLHQGQKRSMAWTQIGDQCAPARAQPKPNHHHWQCVWTIIQGTLCVSSPPASAHTAHSSSPPRLANGCPVGGFVSPSVASHCIPGVCNLYFLPRPLRWERPRRPFQLCTSPLAVLSFPLLIALHVGGEARDAVMCSGGWEKRGEAGVKITIAWPGCFSLHLGERPYQRSSEYSPVTQETAVMTAISEERLAERRKLHESDDEGIEETARPSPVHPAPAQPDRRGLH
jgi:hypothetical protein